MKPLALAIASLGLCSVSLSVFADEQKVERIEVTGSSIKRSIAAEGALPVEVISAESIKQKGITTVEAALQLVSSNQSTLGASQSIGSTTGGQSTANLRGLGANKTLVLLNGRRIANFALDGGSVDLNAIPLAAIERIEVLKDGASAIYGTDAIGGVINFITKNDYTGVNVEASYSAPEAKGGGATTSASVSGGYGHLNDDGFNVFAVLNHTKTSALEAADRSYASTGYRPELGYKASSTTFPANWTQNGKTHNPSYSNCNQPTSFSIPGSTAEKCYYDYTNQIQLVPETEQTNLLTRAIFKLGENHTASLEYSWAQNKATSMVSASPVTGLTMSSTNPYYPGAGITPGADGLDSSKTVSVNWRTVSAGRRVDTSEANSHRLVAEFKGLVYNWDYDVGLSYARSDVTTAFADGYVDYAKIQAGINGVNYNGKTIYLNPFGTPTADEAAYIESAKIKGTSQTAKGETTAFDAKITRDLFDLPGGSAGFAVGVDLRKEKYSTTINREVVDNAVGSGLSGAQDVSGDRNVSAVFTELVLPITKKLEAQLAGRYDHYEGVGGSFNPKIGLRYQPIKQVMFRGSYTTGFRAPTLYELNQPNALTNTSSNYSDPVLCPNGETAINGADSTVSCDTQIQRQYGGNKNLKPEKSTSYSVGVVLEPVKNFTTSIDYWNIELKDAISTLSVDAIMDNPTKYASKIVRCSQVSAAQIAASNELTTACNSAAPGADPIAYVSNTYENLGGVKTSGLDFGLNYALPTSFGRFSFNMDGTYILKYDYQLEAGGEWIKNAGVYSNGSPVPRWQHVANLVWARGSYVTTLTNRFKSGYQDKNSTDDVDPEYFDRVKAYSVLDISLTYTGIKNLTLTGGIKNIENRNPPFSNQGDTFQVGYDARIADPYGRTYFLRAGYRF